MTSYRRTGVRACCQNVCLLVSGQPADPGASLIVKAMGLMTGVEVLVASVEVVVAVVEPGSVGVDQPQPEGFVGRRL